MNHSSDPSALYRTSKFIPQATSILAAGLILVGTTSAQSFIRTHAGTTDYESLGVAVAGIGDIDGDSTPDYVAGSPYFTFSAVEDGIVTVFSGATGAPLHSLSGGFAGLGFGSSAAGLGDLNGDDIPDFIVGAPTLGASPFPGRARVYSGSDFSLLHEWISVNMDDSFGEEVGAAGDLNGDGIMDIAVYALTDVQPGPNGHGGKLYLYSGSDYHLLWSMLGHHLGGPGIGGISAMGDTNADGHDDLLLWERNYRDPSSTIIGRMTIVSGIDGSILRSWEGSSADMFAYGASSMEDLNGDGVKDVAMVSRFESAPGIFQHGLWLFSGANGQVLAHEANTDPISFQGFKGLPDVTGDGVPDLITKVEVYPNRLQVRSGADLHIQYQIEAVGMGDSTFAAPAYLGDVNGDGIADWLAGAPLQGFPLIYQGHVYVVSGADPLGTPYCTNPVPNSSGRVAWLTGAGSSALANDWLTLRVQGLPANNFGFFLCSTTQGYFPGVGGSFGNLCLGGNLGRFTAASEIRNSGFIGETQLDVRWTNLPQPTGRVSATIGESWNFQMWYRDLGGSSNFSSGLQVLVE